MKTRLFIIACVLIAGVNFAKAQPPQSKPGIGAPDGGLMNGLDMDRMETSFMLSVNPMDGEKKDKLNRVASNYRSRNRSILTNMGNSMLAGGVAAEINVVGTEIINLINIRSRQKKAWQEMRQKECIFVDSLQSVKGQSDFYGKQSNYGPLDPGVENGMPY